MNNKFPVKTVHCVQLMFYCAMQTVNVELCVKLVQIPEAHTFVVEYILLLF